MSLKLRDQMHLLTALALGAIAACGGNDEVTFPSPDVDVSETGTLDARNQVDASSDGDSDVAAEGGGGPSSDGAMSLFDTSAERDSADSHARDASDAQDVAVGDASDANPCAGVNCSGHGVCMVVAKVATCVCATGYAASGLSCNDVDECVTNNGGCDKLTTCTNTEGGEPAALVPRVTVAPGWPAASTSTSAWSAMAAVTR